jgi:hypothetical protein
MQALSLNMNDVEQFVQRRHPNYCPTRLFIHTCILTGVSRIEESLASRLKLHAMLPAIIDRLPLIPDEQLPAMEKEDIH